MRDENPSVDQGNQRTPLEGVARPDLLLLRQGFSDAEIQRLSALRLRHRTRPEKPDLSFALCRLQFARWLVEHGALSEEMTCRLEAPPWEEQASVAPEAQDRTSGARDGTSDGPRSGEIGSVSGRRGPGKAWQLAVSHAWTRIREGLARFAEVAFAPGGDAYRRGEDGQWPPYGGAYGSGPYFGNGGARLFDSELGRMYWRDWERW